MTDRIKQLTNFQEAIIVILIGLGLFIYYSIRGLIAISSGPAKQWIYNRSETGGITILIIEIISLVIISYILNKRDWRLEDINLRLSFRTVVHAFLIVLIILIVTGLVSRALVYIGWTDTDSISTVTIERHRNYLIWGLLIVINSIFEEFIYVGYLFRKLENYNKGLFIILSSTLRTIVHLYQGIFTIIPHFIFGVVFASYYSKYKTLITLIISHGLWNLMALWRAG